MRCSSLMLCRQRLRASSRPNKNSHSYSSSRPTCSRSTIEMTNTSMGLPVSPTRRSKVHVKRRLWVLRPEQTSNRESQVGSGTAVMSFEMDKEIAFTKSTANLKKNIEVTDNLQYRVRKSGWDEQTGMRTERERGETKKKGTYPLNTYACSRPSRSSGSNSRQNGSVTAGRFNELAVQNDNAVRCSHPQQQRRQLHRYDFKPLSPLV